ncbi:hypothetical protein QAD02_015345 [Eretmocerus hayati]|uniref:Uncharacterized protein n=1 Tax=Eretmocerus hayati TaxID=131215 RepID=A0ACC2P8Y6_9HYME|nr:hypothetical protein QAD02_015345 [Eretmocerus hayati]
MVNTGLLILTNPSRIAKLLPIIKERVLKTLYIQFFPDKNIFVSNAYAPPTTPPRVSKYSQVIANIYTLTADYSHCLDVRVLLTSLKNTSESIIHTKRPVELVIFDKNYSSNDAKTFMQDFLSNTSMGCEYVIVSDDQEDDGEITVTEESNGKLHKNVVLGGTFDRLHNGHKIFLSEAIFRCLEKLTVGVTEKNMLQKKILWELIEPCPKRIEVLKDFVEDVDPSLTYNITPITDMYGPTKEDPSFNMIVVSEETRKGGEMVNDKRIENKLSKLDIHVVTLAQDSLRNENEEDKISSSNHRMRLLGTRLKQPNLVGKPMKPYLIGLTGGITSGKSSIADKLQKLGSGLINCDLVAHSMYAPGMKCYNLIVETFGSQYVSSDGQIDRKALGNLVFNDKNELNKLNDLMWPVILEETKKRINELSRNGFDIITVEAAVLIQAGWQSTFHEIWTSIIPREEAIKRLMERNKLSKEEAERRILVQPDNTEQVDNAHVVFSTLWSHNFTQQQVQKAWGEIVKNLN